MTNADKIRSMTNKEMANYMVEKTECNFCIYSCKPNMLDTGQEFVSCIEGHLAWLNHEYKK